MKYLFFLLVIGCLISGCSNHPSVGYAVTLCCPGDYPHYRNYSVQTEDIPGFLKQTITDNFNLAFQEKSLQYVHPSEVQPDVVVLLRYVHVNLVANQEPIPPFTDSSDTGNTTKNTWDRQENYNQTLNYMATIEIDIREVGSNHSIWTGHLQRLHRVQPGQYMHEDRASGEILMAFRNVLSSYPTLEPVQP